MNIPTTTLPLNALTPHPENYNTHPASQIKELAESLSTFGQFKNIVTWTCPENMTTPEGHELHEGLTYILAGHGLWLAAMEAGVDELEVKDYSGISYEMAIGLLLIDNAAPLGSEPDAQRLAALLERTREMTADRPGLGAMLERLRLKAGMNGQAIDPMAEWQGMPEFEQEDKTAFQSIHVHFKNQEDVNSFSELIGQKLTEYTRSIWYPEAEKTDMKNRRYQNES